MNLQFSKYDSKESLVQKIIDFEEQYNDHENE